GAFPRPASRAARGASARAWPGSRDQARRRSEERMSRVRAIYAWLDRQEWIVRLVIRLGVGVMVFRSGLRKLGTLSRLTRQSLSRAPGAVRGRDGTRLRRADRAGPGGATGRAHALWRDVRGAGDGGGPREEDHGDVARAAGVLLPAGGLADPAARLARRRG